MINEWTGSAPSTTAAVEIALQQAVEGLLYEVAFPHEVTARWRATASDTRASIAAALALQLRTWTSWTASYTAGSTQISLQGRERGVPLTRGLTVANPKSSYVQRVQAGALPTPQEILITLPATTNGGTWSLTLDWGHGPETASGLASNITPASLAAAIDALSTPTALGGGATCSLLSTAPRQYRLRLAGDLAIGTNVQASANGATLTGNALASVQRTQSVAGEPPAVWLMQAYQLWESFDSIGTQNFTVTIGSQQHTVDDVTICSRAWWDARLPVATSGFDHGTGVGSFSGLFPTTHQGIAFAVPSSVNIAITSNPSTATGSSVSIERLQEYLGETNDEFQWYALARTSSADDQLNFGAFSFDGQTSSTVQFWQIESALKSLSNIGNDDIIVHGDVNHYALVQFADTLGNDNQPSITHTSSASGNPVTEAITISHGAGGNNDIHAITILGATGGAWTAQVPGYDPTGALAHNVSAAALKTAIETTLTAGETVTVTQQGSTWSIEYDGDLAGETVPLITVDVSALTGGTVVASTTTTAAPGQNEIQRLRVDPFASGGVLLSGFRGVFTGEVAYDATPDTWETALTGISTIGNSNAEVAGGVGDLLIEFVGDLGWQPLELLDLDQSALTVTPSGAIAVDIIVTGGGPTDWRTPANWSLGHVPSTGEDVVFASGRNPCLSGYTQKQTWTPTTGSSTLQLSAPADFVEGQAVRLRSTGSLPTAEDTAEQPVVIDSETDYYIVGVNDIYHTLLLSTTPGGTPFLWTGAGTGTHTIAVALQGLKSWQRYSGGVGLPRRDRSGRYEWQPRYLAIDLLPSGVEDNFEVGQGTGSGAARFQVDLRGCPVRGLVIDTGSAADAPPLQLLLDHPAAELHVVNGEVGIAFEPGEVSRLGRLNCYGGLVQLGTVTVSKLGNFNGGIQYVRGAAAADQMEVSR